MSDEDQRLQLLRERHQQLDDEVDELTKRRILLPYDKKHLRRLKVVRLRAKDAIDRFLRTEGEKENEYFNITKFN